MVYRTSLNSTNRTGGFTTNHRCEMYRTLRFNHHIDVLFPLVGWLIEGCGETPLTTGLFDDGINQLPAQTYFYQKDMIEPSIMRIYHQECVYEVRLGLSDGDTATECGMFIVNMMNHGILLRPYLRFQIWGITQKVVIIGTLWSLSKWQWIEIMNPFCQFRNDCIYPVGWVGHIQIRSSFGVEDGNSNWKHS